MKKLIRNRKGQGLVEYALIIAGVALICAVGISIFGHKVSDMINATAVILPGAIPDDNNAIVSGKLIETTSGVNGPITLNATQIEADNGTSRLMGNVYGDSAALRRTPTPWFPKPIPINRDDWVMVAAYYDRPPARSRGAGAGRRRQLPSHETLRLRLRSGNCVWRVDRSGLAGGPRTCLAEVSCA